MQAAPKPESEKTIMPVDAPVEELAAGDAERVLVERLAEGDRRRRGTATISPPRRARTAARSTARDVTSPRSAAGAPSEAGFDLSRWAVSRLT